MGTEPILPKFCEQNRFRSGVTRPLMVLFAAQFNSTAAFVNSNLVFLQLHYKIAPKAVYYNCPANCAFGIAL